MTLDAIEPQPAIDVDEAPDQISTKSLTAALADYFAMPEWALMFNVADQCGVNGRRFADAVAVGMWQSRGYEVQGIEVKISKSDWRKELSTGQKAEAVAKYCDRWWIAAPLGIVNKDELPPTWGLIEMTKRGWRRTVQAPRLSPQPVDRLFMCSLIRRAKEGTEADIARRVAKAIEHEKAAVNKRVEDEVKRRTRHLTEYEIKVKALVEASGKELSEWELTPDLARALKALREMHFCKYGASLKTLSNSLARLKADVDALQAHMPESEA